MSNDPIRALLGHLAEGRARTLDELAAAMETDVGLVQQLLDVLSRGGYLREPQFCEADGHGCARCGEASLCRVMHGVRLWALTDKGLRAAGPS